MADEVVSLELDVNVADGAKSVADLKKSIKDLQNAAFAAGEAGDEALSKKYIDAAGAAKDKIGDLKRAIDAAQDSGSKLGAISKVGATIASGFQAAQGAAALFGSAGKDIEQVLLKVQAATALAQGAQALANATEDIAIAKQVIFTTVTNIASAASKAFGVSAAAGMAMATAGITLVIGAIISLVAYFSEADAAAEEFAKKEEARKEKAARDNEQLTFNQKLDLQNKEAELEILKKKGASLEEINKKENELLDLKIAQNKELLDVAYIDLSEGSDARLNQLLLEQNKLRHEKELLNTKEVKQNKELEESLKKLTDSGAPGSIGRYNFLISESNSRLDKLVPGTKEYNDELKKNLELQKGLNDATELANKLKEKPREKPKAPGEIGGVEGFTPTPKEAPQDPRVTYAAAVAKEIGKINDEAANQSVAKTKEQVDAEIEADRKKRALKIQAVLDTLSTIQNLTELFAGKSKQAQKRAFEINKQASAAQALIATFTSAQNAYESLSKIPVVGPILGAAAAASAITAGLLNVKKIESQKFEGGGGGGGGSYSAPSVGGSFGGTPSIPQLSTPTAQIPQPGNQQDTRVYVLETDIAKTARRVQSIESRATIH